VTAYGTHGVEMSIEAAFGYAPYATPVWTDISKYMRSVTIKRGIAASAVPQPVAGRCTLTLQNSDGRFDPSNTSSPYSPDILITVPIRVRAIYNVVTYPLYYGFATAWTVSYPGKGAVSLTTVECSDALQLFNQQSLAGSMYELEATDTRIGNILDDAGWPAGWRALDSGLARTGVHADTGGSALQHLTDAASAEAGRIFVAADGDVTFHNRTHHSGGATSEGTFGASDLAISDVVPQYDDRHLYNDVTVTRRPGADVTLRIETVPRDESDGGGPVGGPTGNVTITNGVGESVNVDWETVINGGGTVLKTALESLSTIDSVTVTVNAGSVDPNGISAPRPATVGIANATPSAALIVGNSRGALSPNVGGIRTPGRHVDAYANGGSVNFVHVIEPDVVEDVGGTSLPAEFDIITIPASTPIPQTATDATSVTAYRKRNITFAGTAQSNDAEAKNVAEWVLATYKDMQTRIESISIHPQADPTNVWPVVLGVDLRDSLTVTTVPPGGGTGLNQQVTVESITHQIGLDTWKVGYGCFPLAAIETANYWIVGSSTDLDTDTIIA